MVPQSRHAGRHSGPRYVVGAGVIVLILLGVSLAVASGGVASLRTSGTPDGGPSSLAVPLPDGTRTAVAATSPAASPSASPSTRPRTRSTNRPPSEPAVSVPVGTRGCFPYPSKRGRFTVDIKLQPGVKLDRKYMVALRELWGRWPAAWETFAIKADVRNPGRGIRHVLITKNKPGAFGQTYPIEAAAVVRQVDPKDIWDIGHHFHEAAHGIVNFDYTGAPRFYSEGITDFIRFVARGNPTVDKGQSIHLLSTDRDFRNEKKTWDEGYGKGARFLLWLTQHYDRSGAEYQLVRKLLQTVADREARRPTPTAEAPPGKPSPVTPDQEAHFQRIFKDVFGKSYHQLFQAYRASPTVNPHC
jgi:hypothetical protein